MCLRVAIRIGLALTIGCSGLLAPFLGVISVQMRRIEGDNSPLAFAQIALGALLIIEFVYPMMILQVAAYREDRPAAAVQVLPWSHPPLPGPPSSTPASNGGLPLPV